MALLLLPPPLLLLLVMMMMKDAKAVPTAWIAGGAWPILRQPMRWEGVMDQMKMKTKEKCTRTQHQHRPISFFSSHMRIRRRAWNTGAQAGQRRNGASHES